MSSRIIVLIDMDCFYAQIEQRLRPELYGTPVAVAQITGTNTPGLLLAVSYEARAFGVNRGMSVADARRTCPTLTICLVPIMENICKADLTRYRAASEEVFQVFENFSNIIVEKASVDEAYLDVSLAVDAELAALAQLQTNGENERKYDALIQNFVDNVESIFHSTYLADGTDLAEDGKTIPDGYDQIGRLRQWIDEVCRNDIKQLRFVIAAKIVEELRAEILAKTRFHCSAGIGINKMIAKLVCSRHKPKKQTIIPPSFVATIFDSTPISSVRNLGGKLGAALTSTFGVKTMGELALVPPEDLHSFFPDNAARLLKVVAGDDDEPVKPRIEPKSIAVSKNFPGKSSLTIVETIEKWANGLATELSKRLHEDCAKYQRTAKSIVVGFVTMDGALHNKTFPLTDYRPSTIFSTIWAFMRSRCNSIAENNWTLPAITLIQMSASRFESGIDSRARQITSWFQRKKADDNNANNNEGDELCDENDDIMVLDVVEKPISCHSEKALDATEKSEKSSSVEADNPVNEIVNEIEENSGDEIMIIDTDGTLAKPRFEAVFGGVGGRKPLTVNDNTCKNSTNNKDKLSNVSNDKANGAKRKSLNANVKTKSGKVEKRNKKSSKISEFFKR